MVPGLVNDKKNLLTYLLSDLVNVNAIIAILILIGLKGSPGEFNVIYTAIMQSVNIALAYMIPPHTVFGPMRKLDSTGIVIHPSLFAYDFTYGPSGVMDYVKIAAVDLLLNWRNYYFWVWYWISVPVLVAAYVLALLLWALSQIPIVGIVGRLIYCLVIEIGVRATLCSLDCVTCTEFYFDVLFVVHSTYIGAHPTKFLLLYPEVDLFVGDGAYKELQEAIAQARTNTATELGAVTAQPAPPACASPLLSNTV
jgi:hypothetical protein